LISKRFSGINFCCFSPAAGLLSQVTTVWSIDWSMT